MPSRVNVPRPAGTSRYQAPQMRMGRSQFDLTHSHKTTFSASRLIPYFMREVVPGDTQTCKLNAIVRIFSPLDAPIMDDIEVGIDFFFVPNRIVWSHWEEFLGASDAAGAQTVDYTIPIHDDAADVGQEYPLHYMGVPIGLDLQVTDVSCLPQRGYIMIYNEWYRDQNLIAKTTEDTDDGPDGALSTCFKSAKKHDYFTSALPYLQKGDPVTIPIGGSAKVVSDNTRDAADVTVWSTPATAGYYELRTDGATKLMVSSTAGTAGERLYADLSTATSVSINQLREAEAIQRLLERQARGGTRHPEIIRSLFGVDVPDYRTQRPEYLGGGRGFVNVSPVANTSSTATEDQGQLSGVGVGMLRASWAKSFVEHGYVFGILRARGQLSYQQGLDRMWSRSTFYDFLVPDLVNLGEQPIYKRELFVEDDATDNEVFGYQERYAEYRWARSLVTSKFNSDATGSLDFWHLAEDFAASPGLNQTFIEDQTPMGRVTTVDTEPDFIIDGRFDYRVARVLPVRPVPSLAPPRF